MYNWNNMVTSWSLGPVCWLPELSNLRKPTKKLLLLCQPLSVQVWEEVAEDQMGWQVLPLSWLSWDLRGTLMHEGKQLLCVVTPSTRWAGRTLDSRPGSK